MGPKEPLMNRLVRLVLVLLVVAWFVPAVRPLVALGALVLIVRGVEVDYELFMRSPR
jgi:predicted DNA repair protein MutK